MADEHDYDENDYDEGARSIADPYLVLGLSPEATPSEVRAAYFAMVRAHPPERDPDGFKRVRAAYEHLRSPRKRAELALLELRQGEAEFDLGRLHDFPAPPFPEHWLDHLVAIALGAMDAEIDDAISSKRDAIRQQYRNRIEEGT